MRADFLTHWQRRRRPGALLDWRSLDEVHNPMCYGKGPYNATQLATLWEIGPAMSSGVFAYGHYGANIPDTLVYREWAADGEWLTHTLELPTTVRSEVLSAYKIPALDKHLLWIPLHSLRGVSCSDRHFHCTVVSAGGILVARILHDSGWLGLDCNSGLPRKDGGYHSGYSGMDRYLWKLDNAALSQCGSTGYFGPAVEMVHALGRYGQNVLAVFGLTVPFAAWEEQVGSASSVIGG